MNNFNLCGDPENNKRCIPFSKFACPPIMPKDQENSSSYPVRPSLSRRSFHQDITLALHTIRLSSDYFCLIFGKRGIKTHTIADNIGFARAPNYTIIVQRNWKIIEHSFDTNFE